MSNLQTLSDVEPVPAVSPAAARPREDAIRAGVLAALGRPAGLLKVAVLPLWGDKFRVNVWAGSAAGIPNSYFVTADDRGATPHEEPPCPAAGRIRSAP